jgi:hypothetical protein
LALPLTASVRITTLAFSIPPYTSHHRGNHFVMFKIVVFVTWRLYAPTPEKKAIPKPHF